MADVKLPAVTPSAAPSPGGADALEQRLEALSAEALLAWRYRQPMSSTTSYDSLPLAPQRPYGSVAHDLRRAARAVVVARRQLLHKRAEELFAEPGCDGLRLLPDEGAFLRQVLPVMVPAALPLHPPARARARALLAVLAPVAWGALLIGVCGHPKSHVTWKLQFDVSHDPPLSEAYLHITRDGMRAEYLEDSL